ncbi:MAG: ADP-ribosylglycohydrolase [Anaerolinea sp.]|nr:ADP-ribosylglycohydrolase [Anaerolinea sp.]
MNLQTTHRLRGVAVGAAVGDALGMPLEFGLASPPAKLIRDMHAGRLPAGTFTDDTEMALALAESLLAQRMLDPQDVTARFLDWYKRQPPDVGIHTTNVLESIELGETWQTAAVTVQKRYPDSAGNGSVMRSWPVALMCWHDEGALNAWSRMQSQVTHAHEECIASSAFINSMIAQMINGKSPLDAYQYALTLVEMPEGLRQTIRLAPRRKREELRNTGWVRHTVESALWGLLNTDTFEDALVSVINLGADADTAGAVVGALAGAAYGLEAIPEAWKTMLRGEWPLQSGAIWRLPDFITLADHLAGCLTTGAAKSFKSQDQAA